MVNQTSIEIKNTKNQDLMIFIEPCLEPEFPLPKNSTLEIIVKKKNEDFDDGLLFYFQNDSIVIYEARDLGIEVYVDGTKQYPLFSI